MLLTKPLKKAAAKIFAAAPFSLENQTPIIPIRHMKFDFDPKKLDHKFYLNAELASAYFASLSIF